MRINLALGSGGARGFAHIGVIDELRSRGHEIVGVSGTSMGALVGGIFAAGRLDAFADYVRPLSAADVRRFADVSWGGAGLIRLRRVMDQLHEWVGDVRIEDLAVPFTAVATDIDEVHEVWFRRGPLLAAIRASISIPGVFTPVKIGNRTLVDGGLLNPLPMGPLMDYPGVASVGVSLFGRPRRLQRSAPSEESSDAAASDDGEPMDAAESQQSWAAGIGASVTEWLTRHGVGPAPTPDLHYDEAGDVNMLQLGARALDVMQGRVELARSALAAPDVIVWVPMESASVLDFHKATELIDLGRELAAEEFDRMGL